MRGFCRGRDRGGVRPGQPRPQPVKGALRGLHYRMPPVDRDRKFADSPLEQAGFELPVPLARCTILRSGEVGRLKTGEAQIRSVCTLHSTIADFVWS
jgi:hypothetical protein